MTAQSLPITKGVSTTIKFFKLLIYTSKMLSVFEGNKIYVDIYAQYNCACNLTKRLYMGFEAMKNLEKRYIYFLSSFYFL